MKVLIGAGLVVAAIVGISPYFVGAKIEAIAQEQLNLYQVPGYEFSVDIDRGYRSSLLTYRFFLDPQFLLSAYDLTQEQLDQLLQATEEFELNLYVQHGPLLTQNGLGFGLADTYLRVDAEGSPELAEYLELVGIDHLFSAHGRMGFSGKGEAEYEIPAMAYVDSDLGLSSSFSGLQGNTKFEGFGTYSTTYAQSPGASLIVEGATRVDIGEISFNSEMTLDQESTWFRQGSGGVLLDSVLISSPEQSGYLNSLSVDFSLLQGDTAESTDIHYSVGLASFMNGDVGISDAEISFVYENLSNQAIANYMDLMTKVPVNDEVAVQAALMQFVFTELPGALELSPAIAVPRFAFAHEGRTFEASLRVAIDGQNLPPVVNFLRPDWLLPAVTAELNLDADEDLVEDLLAWRAASSIDASFGPSTEYELTPEMRQTMIDQQASMSLGIAESQGYVLRDSGRIRSSVRLADRVLNINGNEQPLLF